MSILSPISSLRTRRWRRDRGLALSLFLLVLGYQYPAIALPPPEEVPEEILRTEVILDARSPVDGKPLTPVEYAALEAAAEAPFRPPNQVSDKVRETVGLLKMRKFIRRYLPIIPIK